MISFPDLNINLSLSWTESRLAFHAGTDDLNQILLPFPSGCFSLLYVWPISPILSQKKQTCVMLDSLEAF